MDASMVIGLCLVLMGIALFGITFYAGITRDRPSVEQQDEQADEMQAQQKDELTHEMPARQKDELSFPLFAATVVTLVGLYLILYH